MTICSIGILIAKSLHETTFYIIQIIGLCIFVFYFIFSNYIKKQIITFVLNTPNQQKFVYKEFQRQKMRKYVMNEHYKFSIPLRLKQTDPEMSQNDWIDLYKKLFQQKTVSLYFGSYDQSHFTTVLQNLVVTDIQELEIEYTGHSKILKYLSFPFLKDLKKLNLSNNFIFSVQFFGIIPAPNLESVTLSDNKIQKLKPFHKNRFQKLKSIDLRNNLIYDIKGIQSLKLNQLILENIDYDKVMSVSLVPIFKLPSKQFKILRIQGFQRISPHPRIQKQIQNKWKKVWIYQKKDNSFERYE